MTDDYRLLLICRFICHVTITEVSPIRVFLPKRKESMIDHVKSIQKLGYTFLTNE